MGKPLDSVADIESPGISRLQFSVILLCALVQIIDGFDGQAMAFAAPVLIHAWKLNHAVMGPVFSAALFGVFAGSLFISPLADRFGRRRVLIWAVFGVAVATLMTGFASTINELLVGRFFTGLGMGASLPTTFVLASEYAPSRRRTAFILVMACGYAIGGAMGGFSTAQLISVYGWSAIFFVGGILALALGLALYAWLPESVRLLAAKPGFDAASAGVRTALNPPDMGFVAKTTKSSHAVIALFIEGRRWTTLLLWSLLFFNFVELNFLNSWLPSLLNIIGLEAQQAVRVTAMFQIGGLFGILLLGFVSDQLGISRALALVLVVASIAMVLIASVAHSAAVLTLVVAIAGFAVIGSMNILFALAAIMYPTTIRSTGSGWAIGVGRLGSIAGPLVGGLLLAARVPTERLFLIAAVVPLLELIALAAMVRAKSYKKVIQSNRLGILEDA